MKTGRHISVEQLKPEAQQVKGGAHMELHEPVESDPRAQQNSSLTGTEYKDEAVYSIPRWGHFL